jgi:hypothetical protein
MSDILHAYPIIAALAGWFVGSIGTGILCLLVMAGKPDPVVEWTAHYAKGGTWSN